MKNLNVKLELICPLCHNYHYVEVNEDDLYAWEDGELTQKAFPYLSATEREQLISNLCPDCQKTIFGEEE